MIIMQILPDLTHLKGDLNLMSSILIEKIPDKISNKIDRMLWLEESVENLTYIVQKLTNQIKDLESKQPQTKVSPVEQRAEILYKETMKANSLNSRQVMHILEVKQHVQAIRAMKYTAIIHSDDLEIVKSDISNKSYSLRRRIDSSINPYSVRV